MGKICIGVKKTFEDYCSLTSTHGIPHVGQSKPVISIIFWFIITAGSAGGFLYQFIFQLLRLYFSYPVNVDTTIVYGQKVFPAVTFCMLNPWKISKISGTPLEDLVNAYLSGAANSKYGFVSPATTMNQQRASKYTQIMYETLKALDENNNTGMAYSYDELFIKCVYNTNDCNQSDFKAFYDPFYGRCYTFNYDGKYKSTRASPNYGLRTIFRIKQNEFLPWTTSIGVAISIHDQNRTPFAETTGYFVPVEKSSLFAVHLTTNEKLPHPYGTCTNKNKEQPSYYDDTYNVEECLRSCIQDKIVRKCGCYDPSYAQQTSKTAISCYNMGNVSQAIDCIWSITNSNGISGMNVNKECKCPQGCKENIYSVTMSNAFWPAQKYKPLECIIDAYAPKNSNLTVKFDEWNKPQDSIVNCLAGKARKGKNSTSKVDCYTIMSTTTPPTTTKRKTKSATFTPTTSAHVFNSTSTYHPKYSTWDPPNYTPNENCNLSCIKERLNGSLSWGRRKRSGENVLSTPTTIPLSTTMAIPNNLAPCVDWYETNTLMAEVYFERMDFESNVETPAYPVLYLLSDIGGQMGFWLGMSVISLIEIIFFFFNVFQCFCCPSKFSDNKKIDNKPNKKTSLAELNASKLYNKESEYTTPPNIML